MIEKKTKIAFINPKHPFGMDNLAEKFMPNLGLATLAALVPNQFSIEMWDENVSPLNFDNVATIVAITGYYVHANRMKEIAKLMLAKGCLICIGGAHASSDPEDVREYASVLFIGEGEYIWPQFLHDYLNGKYQNEYVQKKFINMSDSPLPNYACMDPKSYHVYLLQTARGCPYDCEFCSVVQLVGHVVRKKTMQKITEECENIYKSGIRFIFLADDNLLISRKYAIEVLQTIAKWNNSKAEKSSFSIQSSIDATQNEAILNLLVEANVKNMFIGIESSEESSLKALNKPQNIGRDLTTDIHNIVKRGIFVQMGMIIGSDGDDLNSFDRMFNFIQKSGAVLGIPLPLVAPGRTNLKLRLEKEGRWTGLIPGFDPKRITNIVPLNMTIEELTENYLILIKKLYDPKNFWERVFLVLSLLPTEKGKYPLIKDEKLYNEMILQISIEISSFGLEYKKVAGQCIEAMMNFPEHRYSIFFVMLAWNNILNTIQHMEQQ